MLKWKDIDCDWVNSWSSSELIVVMTSLLSKFCSIQVPLFGKTKMQHITKHFVFNSMKLFIFSLVKDKTHAVYVYSVWRTCREHLYRLKAGNSTGRHIFRWNMKSNNPSSHMSRLIEMYFHISDQSSAYIYNCNSHSLLCCIHHPFCTKVSGGNDPLVY